tara:strand:+ start:535 stop:942 length:408 start_codon:yes stop_codon:yes gene_type:complete
VIKREQIIICFVSLIILLISFDLVSTIIFDNKIEPRLEEEKSIPSGNEILGQETELMNLSTKSWGKDIFYNRSYKYKSWFSLTGITRFDDGNKAIINGTIIHEKDKIKGFTVTKIANNYVLLKRNKHIVTLKIKE